MQARTWTDDHMVDITFDCSTWWRKLSPAAQEAIRDQPFQTYETDDAARFYLGTNADIDRMFEYLGIVNATREAAGLDRIGFEVEVDLGDES